MFGEQKFMLIGAGVAALVLLVLVKKKGAAADAGAAVGAAAVDLAGGAVAGVAEGIGDQIGVPRTDMTECERAKAEGRKLDASFACPAGDFISYTWDQIFN
jgi:hypothetical protein